MTTTKKDFNFTFQLNISTWLIPSKFFCFPYSTEVDIWTCLFYLETLLNNDISISFLEKREPDSAKLETNLKCEKDATVFVLGIVFSQNKLNYLLFCEFGGICTESWRKRATFSEECFFSEIWVVASLSVS